MTATDSCGASTVQRAHRGSCSRINVQLVLVGQYLDDGSAGAVRHYASASSPAVESVHVGKGGRTNASVIGAGELSGNWGTEAFCEEIRARIGNKKLNDVVPQSRQERSHPTLKVIKRVICEGYDSGVPRIYVVRAARPGVIDPVHVSFE